MGYGKSTIGRKLETMLGYFLVDTDQLIEEKACISISDIFSCREAPLSRELESAVLNQLSAPGTSRWIIATGGGIIGRKANHKLLSKLCYVVWLQAPVDAVLKRTGRNRDRPLLDTENPGEKTAKLLADRSPFHHELADLQLETAGLETGEIAYGILGSARHQFAAKL